MSLFIMAAVAAVNNMGACAHNPRGNLWFNDESTYGHKLLMKMGWSKGKGLGKNEDGIKENVKVKFRNTNFGLGYKDDPYDTVMKTEYESILKNLSANYSQKEKCSVEEDNKNNEQKSRVVKSKLRYPKLFFGKDVSKYSEKDMKSIFICSLPSGDNQEMLEDSASSQKQGSEMEFTKENTTFSSTLSISDYFAVKMKEKKNHINGPSHQQSSIDSENIKIDNSFTMITKQLSKKKERKLEVNVEQESVCDSDLQQTELCDKIAENFTASSKKKSSKRKRKKYETTVDETDSLNTGDIKFECTAPKKKKQKLSDDLVGENNISEVEISEAVETESINSSIPSKKRKKSKVSQNENSCLETPSNNMGKISCQIELSFEQASYLKKKHKKDKEKKFTSSASEHIENHQIVNDNLPSKFVGDEIDNGDAIYFKKKKKKFKKLKLKSCLKSRTGNYSLKNVSFNENVFYRVIDTDHESVECLIDECNILQDDDLMNVEIDSVDNDSKNKFENNTSDTQLPSDSHMCSSESGTVRERVLDEGKKKNSSESSSTSSKSLGPEVPEAVLDEVKDNCSLSSLPSPKSSHYNSWVESQRQALKMQMYKKMLKSLKKHKILKTTNLLTINGYGNWGFK